MMKNVCKKARLWIFKAVLILITICTCILAIPRAVVPVEAASGDRIAIQAYDIRMEIGKDRQVRVHERITVQFLRGGLTMFYRSLPKENARYYDISATCINNPAFYYTVEENPDTDEFFDINCIGGVEYGATWIYDIYFTMENSSGASNTDSGMIIDVVPFGFTVPLQNVTGCVIFPYAVKEENLKTYVGYGSMADANLGALSADGKTFTFACDLLSVHYNDTYSERVADGVTLDFIMEGKFDNYHVKRFFTMGMLVIFLVGVAAVALTVLVVAFLGKKREIVTVVNLKAPDNLDPMQMGKLLDGVVDSEDVTSMLFYFAHKGWLLIDMSDEKDPVFIKRCPIPSSAAPHEKTLFNGIFATGERVRVSHLKNVFYQHVDRAKVQVQSPKMFEKSSIFTYLLGGILSVAYIFLSILFLAKARLGTTYVTTSGLWWGLPVVVVSIVGYVMETYRYKWKNKTRKLCRVAQIVVTALAALIFAGVAARHIATEYERYVICLFAGLLPFITQNAICRKESYCETLGQILGFKEFIIVTEEDKIKFMLEENPTLYYKILPYAQVLGVTNEWENKFKNILIEPPEWCTSTRNVTYFDYVALRYSMNRAMHTALTRPSEGGSSVGRSGGGGRSGGFGGGGFGGGGGGAR